MSIEPKNRFTWSSFKIDEHRHIFCVTDNLHIYPVERFYNGGADGELIPYNKMRSLVAEYCKERNGKEQQK